MFAIYSEYVPEIPWANKKRVPFHREKGKTIFTYYCRTISPPPWILVPINMKRIWPSFQTTTSFLMNNSSVVVLWICGQPCGLSTYPQLLLGVLGLSLYCFVSSVSLRQLMRVWFAVLRLLLDWYTFSHSSSLRYTRWESWSRAAGRNRYWERCPPPGSGDESLCGPALRD